MDARLPTSETEARAALAAARTEASEEPADDRATAEEEHRRARSAVAPMGGGDCRRRARRRRGRVAAGVLLRGREPRDLAAQALELAGDARRDAHRHGRRRQRRRRSRSVGASSSRGVVVVAGRVVGRRHEGSAGRWPAAPCSARRSSAAACDRGHGRRGGGFARLEAQVLLPDEAGLPVGRAHRVPAARAGPRS